MQDDFDANFPELDIQIIGINEVGQEFGNSNITEKMPWLQDVDTNGDGKGEVWKLWNVEWRDLTILDRNNVPVATYNLTDFNLADPAKYAAVRQAFLSLATNGEITEGESARPDVSQSEETGSALAESVAVVDQALAAGHDWRLDIERD